MSIWRAKLCFYLTVMFLFSSLGMVSQAQIIGCNKLLTIAAGENAGEWELKAGRKIIDSLQRLLGPLRVNGKVKVILAGRKHHQRQWVYQLFSHSEVNVSIQGTTRHPGSRRLTNAAISHEIGHEALFDHLAIRFKSDPYILKAIQEDPVPREIEKCKLKIEQLKERRGALWDHVANGSLSHAEGERRAILIDDEWERLKMQIIHLDDSRSLINYNQIPHSEAYDEVFADFVAVLHTGDLDSVSKVLIFDPNSPLDSKDVRVIGRSFSHQTSIETWKQTESHILFAPVRSYLGQYIVTNPQSNPTKLIESVGQAIGNELLKLAKLPGRGKSLSVPMRNHSLILAIKEILEGIP